jgi:hypothetical protein
MNRRVLSFVFVLATICAAGTNAAQTLQHGDVVASGSVPLVIGFTFPSVRAYTPSAELRIPNGPANVGGNDALWSPDGHLYALDMGGFNIDVLSPQLTVERSLTLNTTVGAAALTMNARREIIVVFRDGTLRWLSPSGQTLRTASIPVNGDHEAVVTADLGIDQCVLYYFALTTVGLSDHVGRYDVCRGERLADLPENISYAFSGSTIRVAPDGAVLFTGLTSVFRWKNGIMTTIPVPAGDGAVAMALLDSDTAWLGQLSLRKVALSTGEMLPGPQALPMDVRSLTIYGVPRAAAAVSTSVGVPTLSPAAIAAFAVLLLAIAVARLR